MKQPILNHFYNYDEICEYLFAAAKEYPNLMELSELARTDEDRVIWGITLAKGTKEGKPAFYVQGGIHAQEGMGITCCLNFLWTVLQNPSILDKIIIYILPCVNPDGSDVCVRTGLDVRSKIEKLSGLPNAVVPKDMDGDGKILLMRIEDPAGAWACYPECGDVIVDRSPEDTEGPFYNVFVEGEVENYEGGPLQLGYRDLDLNRQYGLDWKDNRNGGDFPGNHVEIRTIMRFLSSHPEIYMVMDCHCGTRALIYGTPDHPSDHQLLRNLVTLGNEITGIPPITHARYGAPTGGPDTHLYGHIDTYCYESLGIPIVTVELGNGYNSLGMTAQEIFDGDIYGREIMSKMVAMHEAKGRKIAAPWKPYHHPQLGDIEIGGQFCGNAYFMDPDDMIDLIPKVATYFLKAAEMIPALTFRDVKCDALGGNVYRIRAKVINNSSVSTKPMQGATGYHANANLVRFKVIGAKEIFNQVSHPTVAFLNPTESKNLEWFISGNPGDTVTIKAMHCKSLDAEEHIVLL